MIVLIVFFILISGSFVQTGFPEILEGESPVIHTMSVVDPMQVHVEWSPVIGMGRRPVLGYKVLLWTLDLDNDTAIKSMEDLLNSFENAKEFVIRSTLHLSFEFTAKYNYIYQVQVQAYTVDGDGPLSVPSVFRLDRPEQQNKLIEMQISGSDIMSNWQIAKNYYNTRVELTESYEIPHWDIDEPILEYSEHNDTDNKMTTKTPYHQIKQPLGSNKNLSVNHTLYGTKFTSDNKGKSRDKLGKEGKQHILDYSQSGSKRYVHSPGHLNKKPESRSPKAMGYLPEYYMKISPAYNGNSSENSSHPSIKNKNSEQTSSAENNPISQKRDKVYSPEYKIDYSPQKYSVVYDDRFVENASGETKQNHSVYKPTVSELYSVDESAGTKISAPEEVLIDIKTDLKEYKSTENQYPPENKYEGSNLNPYGHHPTQLKQHEIPEIPKKSYYDYGMKTKMQASDEGLINSRKSFIRPVELRQYGPYNRPEDDIQYTPEILAEILPKGQQNYQPYPNELKKYMQKSSLRPLPKESIPYPSETRIRPSPSDNLKPKFYEKSTEKPFVLEKANVNLPKKLKNYPSENLAIHSKRPIKSHVNLYLNDGTSDYHPQHNGNEEMKRYYSDQRSPSSKSFPYQLQNDTIAVITKSNDKQLKPSYNRQGAEILYHRDKVVVNSNISNRGIIKSVSKNQHGLEKKDNAENINNNSKNQRARVFRPLKEIKYD